jgi:hypothetical protein
MTTGGPRRVLAGDAFGDDLAPLVVADDVPLRRRVALIGRSSVPAGEKCRDRARVHDPPHARRAGGRQDVFGSFDIGGVDLARAARIEAIVGGAVVDGVRSPDGGVEGGTAAEIAPGRFLPAGRRGSRDGSWPDEAADGTAAGEKRADHVCADEPGGARDEVRPHLAHARSNPEAGHGAPPRK